MTGVGIVGVLLYILRFCNINVTGNVYHFRPGETVFSTDLQNDLRKRQCLQGN